MECSRVELSNRGLDEKKDRESGQGVKTGTLSLTTLDSELVKAKDATELMKTKERNTNLETNLGSLIDPTTMLSDRSF